MLLLDTHTFLWFMNGDSKLPESFSQMIQTDENIFVSVVTFWEMAIKNSLGKLVLPSSISGMMEDCAKLKFTILPINGAHLDRLADLPWIHRDPFDRLLICQAQEEGLTLVTVDENIVKYEVDCAPR